MSSAPPTGPADTSMMGVVHSALRRDLVRARLVLDGDEVSTQRRVALGEHLLWMMETLHHHHEGEDAGLFPLVLQHNPDAAELVAAMDGEHGAVVPAMEQVERAAAAYRDGAPDSRTALLAALAALDASLLPHLRREETEMMPVVSATLTEQQWQDWDLPTNVRSKPPLRLAMEGHWLLDGADATARAKLLGQVPAVPRFILVHGFRRVYARRHRRLWGDTPAARVPSLTLDIYDDWAA